MAMAALPLLASGAQAAGSAAKNDIAVIRWKTQPKKKKGKKAAPPKDIELHLNGAAIGLGLAAIAGAGLLGAAALWASGMGLRVEGGKEKIVKTITTVSGDPRSPTVRTVAYSGNNRPLRTFDGYPEGEEILTKTELLEGWKMVEKSRSIVENADSGGGYKIYNAYKFQNAGKRRVRMITRPRFSIGGNSENTDEGLFGAVTGEYGDKSAHYLS